MQGQNLAKRTFTRTKTSSDKLRTKGAYYHCGKLEYIKREYKKLQAEQGSYSNSDTHGSRREVNGEHRAAVIIQNKPRTHKRA